MYILAPSVLAADFGKLAEDTAKAREGGASYLHLDVMDGGLCPQHFLRDAGDRLPEGATRTWCLTFI